MKRGAFSLIEVVAAVAIFAVAVVALVTQLGPLGQSIVNAQSEVIVAHLGPAVRARLAAVPFDTALQFIRDMPSDAGETPENGDRTRVLFATARGAIGMFESAFGDWRDANGAVVPDSDKVFEIVLTRNDVISPKSADAAATLVAYDMRIGWPIRPLHDRQRVVIFTGFVSR